MSRVMHTASTLAVILWFTTVISAVTDYYAS